MTSGTKHGKPPDFSDYKVARKKVEEVLNLATKALDSLEKTLSDRDKDKTTTDLFGSLRSISAKGLVSLFRYGVPASTLLLNKDNTKGIEKGLDSGLKFGAEGLARLRAHLTAKLKDKDRLDTYLNYEARLAHGLGRDLARLAAHRPLLVGLDTYEIAAEGDRLLRLVMAAAGPRVGWLLAGRDGLWAARDPDPRNPYEREPGYQDVTRAAHSLSVNFGSAEVGKFSPGELTDYFQAVTQAAARAGFHLPALTPEVIEELVGLTEGIPLAVKVAAEFYLEKQGDLELLLSDTSQQTKIVDTLVARYLLHTGADPSELAKLYGLALLRRADRPQTICAVLSLTTEMAQRGYRAELSRLHRRYSFIFTEEESVPDLSCTPRCACLCETGCSNTVLSPKSSHFCRSWSKRLRRGWRHGKRAKGILRWPSGWPTPNGWLSTSTFAKRSSGSTRPKECARPCRLCSPPRFIAARLHQKPSKEASSSPPP